MLREGKQLVDSTEGASGRAPVLASALYPVLCGSRGSDLGVPESWICYSFEVGYTVCLKWIIQSYER